MKKGKPSKRPAVYDGGLLPRGEGVASQPELLVLREPRDELAVLSTSSRREASELEPGWNRVRRVAGGLVVAVPAASALVDAGVEHREPRLETARVELLHLLVW